MVAIKLATVLACLVTTEAAIALLIRLVDEGRSWLPLSSTMKTFPLTE